MSKYIDAEAMIANALQDSERSYLELVAKHTPSIDLDDYVPKEFHDKTCEAMAKRHQEEIADMVERADADRPQGKWIRDRYWSRGVGMGEEFGFFYKCSLCEYEVENGYTRCGFNFCPYCGAKMKGADDECL